MLLCGGKYYTCHGGKASAALGSDGSGYPLAKTFGHHIVTRACIVWIKMSGTFFKAIAGVRTHGTVTLYVSASDKAAEKNGYSDTGELQMTHMVFPVSGISGEPLCRKRIAAGKDSDCRNRFHAGMGRR